MKYIIRGQKIDNTDAIKQYIESKLSKLDKYFDNADEIEATVLTKVHGRDQVIEVTIPTKHFLLRNEEAHEDLYAAIDKITDKLERQIRKNKEKINKKINKTIIKDFEYDLEDEYEEEEQIVKRKQIELKPIDEEEAIIQMEMLGHSFFVYKDVNTNKVCILYKRKSGDYGIIETQ
ncbi:MAG: ribosome-associated translation inhibitor RaiA [Bacilli bacterium]|nr:ribosome-associated translation inhibitor RaiA [Bacilli bacterium]